MRFRWLWLIQLASLLSYALWAMFDLRSEAISHMLESVLWAPEKAIGGMLARAGIFRFCLVCVIALLAAGSLMGLCMQQIQGKRDSRGRSIATLLAMTSVVAVWFTLLANHPSLAWQGHRVRVALQIRRLESIATPLRNDWPERDGELAGVGPFMAYPFGQPKTLVLLHAPLASVGGPHVAAIDRSADGTIRLQLTGTGWNDWAEWHSQESEPQSFVDGLQDSHQLLASSKLPHGWHLVRYE